MVKAVDHVERYGSATAAAAVRSVATHSGRIVVEVVVTKEASRTCGARLIQKRLSNVIASP
jgi:hypothetical protein